MATPSTFDGTDASVDAGADMDKSAIVICGPCPGDPTGTGAARDATVEVGTGFEGGITDASLGAFSEGATEGGIADASIGVPLDGGMTADGASGPSGPCTFGEVRACLPYPFAPAIPNETTCTDGGACESPCRNGTETCVAADGGLAWGPCVNAIGPQPADTCDPGNDGNCNGIPNEGCTCINGLTQSCGKALGAKGACAAGTTSCSSAQWSPCSIQPAVVDDCAVRGDDSNCNGLANDTCACTPGQTGTCAAALDAKGACASGTATCNAAGTAWGCSISPTIDTCDDGNDNNCDGITNDPPGGCVCFNGTTASCAAALNAKGACAAGMTLCSNGGWGACNVQATTDNCDSGNDNNCDGIANDPPGGCACINGSTQTCGPCGGGTQSCTNGAWSACQRANPQFTYFRDADGDGFGDPVTTMNSCSATPPAGWVVNNQDCCDQDANARPGSTYCSTSMRLCGDNWDYNCDGRSDGVPCSNDASGTNGNGSITNFPRGCSNTITCAFDTIGNCTGTCSGPPAPNCTNACNWENGVACSANDNSTFLQCVVAGPNCEPLSVIGTPFVQACN